MSSTALTGERQTQTAELLPGGQTAVQSPVLAPIDLLPVADDGEFSATEVVRANDRRLGDARTPLAHRHTAEDITQTEDRRFVSAEERGAWNAHLSETDPHGDRAWAADPSHLTQDSTHRFITDAERTAWNAKAVELPIGVPGGAAPLNEFGQVPASYLPPRSANDYATAYLGRTETAADSGKLGGKSADEFAGKIHAHDELYLGKTAKATSAGDADKLGGKPASDYATQADLEGLTPGGGTGGSTEGAWTLVRNPNDYLQSLAVGATGRCIQCESGNIGQVGGLPWAWAGVVPAMAGAPVSLAYLYILRASSGQASHHAYARVHVTGALEIIEHGDSVDDYRAWRVADFVGTWLTEPRAMQIACAPGVHPVVQVLNGATWTTVAGVEESVGTAPAWGLATLSTGQHVQAYDWPAGRCPLGAILIGAALAADELAAWAASGRWPYWVEAGGSAVSVPMGTLTIGRRYYIAEYTTGDDFTNCGAASNAVGVSFIATGASPTVWAGSRVVPAGAVSIPQVQSGVAALPDCAGNGLSWGVLPLMQAVGRWTSVSAGLVVSQSGPPASPAVPLQWMGNGDTCGVCYYLGALSGAWINPHSAGQVCVVVSSSYSLAPDSFVNRAQEYGYGAGLGSFAGIDLGPGRALRPNAYTLRGYTSEDRYMRNWVLEATNFVTKNSEAAWNAATWTVLDTRKNDVTMQSPQIWNYSCPQPQTAYRYFRWRLTGPDSLGHNYMCLTEFELYGELSGSFTARLPNWATGWVTNGAMFLPAVF